LSARRLRLACTLRVTVLETNIGRF
jgi:hypothetical protein